MSDESEQESWEAYRRAWHEMDRARRAAIPQFPYEEPQWPTALGPWLARCGSWGVWIGAEYCVAVYDSMKRVWRRRDGAMLWHGDGEQAIPYHLFDRLRQDSMGEAYDAW